jgi:hypothetical protein
MKRAKEREGEREGEWEEERKKRRSIELNAPPKTVTLFTYLFFSSTMHTYLRLLCRATALCHVVTGSPLALALAL